MLNSVVKASASGTNPPILPPQTHNLPPRALTGGTHAADACRAGTWPFCRHMAT